VNWKKDCLPRAWENGYVFIGDDHAETTVTSGQWEMYVWEISRYLLREERLYGSKVTSSQMFIKLWNGHAEV